LGFGSAFFSPDISGAGALFWPAMPQALLLASGPCHGFTIHISAAAKQGLKIASLSGSKFHKIFSAQCICQTTDV